MRRILKMIFIIVGALLIIGTVAFVISTDNLAQFGAGAKGERLAKMKRSPNFDGEKFINPVETSTSWDFGQFLTMVKRSFFGKEERSPKKQIDIVELDSSSFDGYSSHDLRVTWMGHSSIFLEIDGFRLLIDPVWSKRCSPSSLGGPERFHPTPIALDGLPELDAVLISHDHYDHLDKDAVCRLAETGVRFIIPLGVGAHLERWGIDQSQFTEMDWWDSGSPNNSNLTITATPARHFSGRGLFIGANNTLWLSWAIIGPKHRVFFSGDTGEFPGLAEIGDKFGPFDLTMIKCGAYDPLWPDIHLNPEQAVQAHLTLKGEILLPIHWGTFNLAFHDWFEPPERIWRAAELHQVKAIFPRPGQIVSIADPPTVDYWWREYK
ncbi:MAG: hypothetical protein GY839_15375 [candidate division Zixibacteria bacterium]|nr:hypothetical protein [candidate division Zixibacteria bacterium]